MLILQSILEVAENFSSAYIFHKKKVDMKQKFNEKRVLKNVHSAFCPLFLARTPASLVP